LLCDDNGILAVIELSQRKKEMFLFHTIGEK